MQTRHDVIRRQRVIRGLYKQEVADLAGISLSQYGRIEGGSAGGGIKTLHKIAAALGLDITDIVEFDGEAVG